MPTAKTAFVCQECGYRSIRWLGKCPGCGAWNSFAEELVVPSARIGAVQSRPARPRPITEVETSEGLRVSTGISSLDEVLGGGLVIGSVVLLGGEPGIGKSTLSLQIGKALAKSGRRVLYASGEESPAQIRLRAERMSALDEDLFLLSETDLEAILSGTRGVNPDVVILDSIQTVYLPEVQSAPGSVSQVRECASRLTRYAKEEGKTVLIIGHVTKEGVLAGPRTLEHLVDVVLYFEGDRYEDFRILRSVKNRFGPAGELAVFEMTGMGLREVPNPSEFFVSHYNPGESGVAIGAVVEGARPFLVEVQALVTPTSGFGVPMRRSQGIDPNRLSLILAVLERRLNYRFYEYDVFVSVMGGIRIKDPGLDLAVALAMLSSLKGEPLPPRTVAIGEIGLTGEIRPVSRLEQRIREAKRVGFANVICPFKKDLKLEEVWPVRTERSR